MDNFQEKVRVFVEKYNLAHSPEISALDLVSELGEVAKEILKSTNYGTKEPKYPEEIKGELGDAFYSLINLANHCNVDLEKALELALQKYEKRLSKGSAGSEND